MQLLHCGLSRWRQGRDRRGRASIGCARGQFTSWARFSGRARRVKVTPSSEPDPTPDRLARARLFLACSSPPGRGLCNSVGVDGNAPETDCGRNHGLRRPGSAGSEPSCGLASSLTGAKIQLLFLREFLRLSWRSRRQLTLGAILRALASAPRVKPDRHLEGHDGSAYGKQRRFLVHGRRLVWHLCALALALLLALALALALAVAATTAALVAGPAARRHRRLGWRLSRCLSV
jgi:hypothetical protein